MFVRSDTPSFVRTDGRISSPSSPLPQKGVWWFIKAGRSSEATERVSKAAGRPSKAIKKVLEAYDQASEAAIIASKARGRASEKAEKASEPA